MIKLFYYRIRLTFILKNVKIIIIIVVINWEKKEMSSKKEIRLKIKSTRYEVEASLFSGDDSENLLTIRAEDADDTPEIIEINSVGTLYDDGDRVDISYEESEATGMEGSVSTVSFLRSQSGIVSMTRSGAVSTVLTFEAGKRYHCVYKTPYMPFEICVRTINVENLLMTMGTLDIDYVIEIRGARAERTKFRMQILK